MGRFETTAETYLRFREPYPAAFFADVAKELRLRGDEALIDLGTGPGVLALGFAPHVGTILGVDPEPAMLGAARANALSAGIDLPLVEGRTEDLPEPIGPFDVVTIGRALHWMDRPKTVAVLDRILQVGGTILVCGSGSAKDDRNPWHETFETVSRSWAPTREESGFRVAYDGWFEGTPFAETGEIATEFVQEITPELLFERALTRSVTSPAVLGDRVEACRRELLAALAPFFQGGPRLETLSARATIARRR
jgi:ubiquinone/menaquinone biosynthesis C-methylase UbiE